MQTKHVKNLLSGGDTFQRITSICWTPNNLRMAAVSMNRTLLLFDEHGEQKEKITTKPADPTVTKNFVVKAMCFSPDSTRLAVAQSDNIVFVYKIGNKWGEKKSICNKFPQSSAVTCLSWPSAHANEFFFGLADGKVKLGNLRNNRSSIIYSHEEYVVSMSCNTKGNALVAGHLDGSIFLFSVSTSGSVSKTKIIQHSCIPYTLSWGENIVVAGNDSRIVFYDSKGEVFQKFDYSHDDKEKEYCSGEFSPSGQSVVVGGFNRFRTFSFSHRRNVWEESALTEVQNLLTITAVGWKKDGSRVAIGSLSGGIEMYDACLRRYKYKGKFEMTYVSPSRVIVKRLGKDGEKTTLHSTSDHEITKVNVYLDRFLVAHTQWTVIVTDLADKRKSISEVEWQFTGHEKFVFDNPGVCMICNAGEISLVEFGNKQLLGLIRTEHTSPHLLSVRVHQKKPEELETDEDGNPQPSLTGIPPTKMIAYLVDLQTINIFDLVNGTVVATVNHDSKIDWLELNNRGTKLLFRDKHRALNLLDLATQARTTLLNLSGYAQWVPKSDVAVAQSRNDLCVWYNIDSPESVTMLPIKGDVIEIERSGGKTEVVIDEGIQTSYVALNEPLIAFGTAVEDRKFEKAADILENLPMTPETEAMWRRLSSLTLEARKLEIAERAFAALGDVARSKYLRKINRIVQFAEKERSIVPGTDYYEVQARLEQLEKQFSKAESIFVDQAQIEDAMEMYQALHKWEDSIRVAEAHRHPDVANLRKYYYQWLLDTKQEERAAILKEREGDYFEAINLYLKGGLPARAAQLVMSNNLYRHTDLLQRIAEALFVSNLFEKAGIFFEKLDNVERALDSYRKGHAYRAAVELARVHFPQRVVGLEEEWGDWLVSVGQVDQAINHYLEAGQYPRAIEAAIESKQWNKAVNIVEGLDHEVAKKYYKKIGHHYEETLNLESAERYYVKGGMPEEAVEMYTKANLWDAAHKIAVTYMSEREVTALYLNQATKLEQQTKYREAEKLYITISEQDQAINMYKKARLYDDMLRLVTTYHKNLLRDTYIHLAQQLESEVQFKQAEKYYIEADDWKSAVSMYRTNDLWDDALRVAKQYGGQTAQTQVAQVWAQSLGGEAGVNLLLKFGLIEPAVEFALECNHFRKAAEICKTYLKRKLPEVYLKHAQELEEEGQLQQAEAEYIKAQSPQDAIQMYIHRQDWLNATRVAETYDPQSVFLILDSQARVAAQQKDFELAERLFIQARKPEEAFKMYKELGMTSDMDRILKEYLPDAMLPDVMGIELPGKGMNEVNQKISAGDYSGAIDLLLRKTVDNTDDQEELEEAWESAVKLAINNVPERTGEVVKIVSKRLSDIKRYASAAALLEGIDLYKDAIDVCVISDMWEQAHALAASKAPEYVSYVIECKLNALVQRGEWDKALEIAQQQGQEVLGKFTSLLATQLMKENKITDAVDVFVEWGAVPIPECFPIYITLSKAVLGLPADVDSFGALKSLRKMLFRLVSSLKELDDVNPTQLQEFQRLSLIAHLAALKDICKNQGLGSIYAKLSTSLVRYCGDIPADKAYYEAGIACKEAHKDSLAFLFLNRFIDISDDIGNDNASILENSGFENTDIPIDLPIPTSQYLHEDQREDAKNWVLSVSIDSGTEHRLSSRSCDTCSAEIYEASSWCYQCNTDFEICVVTGYPVLRSTKINCTSCAKAANREDWNKFVSKFKCCPWCENPQSPSY